jgi:hypothetical protein
MRRLLKLPGTASWLGRSVGDRTTRRPSRTNSHDAHQAFELAVGELFPVLREWSLTCRR